MWYKGIRLILDGLKAVRDQGLEFTMLFVGDGADRKEIERYAQKLSLTDCCIFTGAISDRELLRAYFCGSDLFLFPSTFDTNGIVVREAAACGLPSMLIRGSCAAEGITDGRNGFLVEENAEAIGDFLTKACRTREHLKETGLNAMNEIYLSWEESVSRAYHRYELVKESAERNGLVRAHCHYDEVFAKISEINDELNQARLLSRNLVDGIKDTKDELAQNFREKKEELSQEIQKTREELPGELQNTKEEIVQGFREIKQGIREVYDDILDTVDRYL